MDAIDINLKYTIFQSHLLDHLQDVLQLEHACQKELSGLPIGSITYKLQGGRRYPYLQYKQNGAIQCRYIKRIDIEECQQRVSRRKELEETLVQIDSYKAAAKKLFLKWELPFPEYSAYLGKPQNAASSSAPLVSAFREEGLIHRTVRGDMVRSKGEVVIADNLYFAGLNYSYEKLLVLGKYALHPDFTIYEETADPTYWEHCGMMNDPKYRKDWKWKKSVYAAHGILEGSNLIVTCDDEKGGVDSSRIRRIIQTYFG